MKRLSDVAVWLVDLIPAEEGGLIVNFPDLPNGWSRGETRDEALGRSGKLTMRPPRPTVCSMK